MIETDSNGTGYNITKIFVIPELNSFRTSGPDTSKSFIFEGAYFLLDFQVTTNNSVVVANGTTLTATANISVTLTEIGGNIQTWSANV